MEPKRYSKEQAKAPLASGVSKSRARLTLMSPAALLELEEKAQELVRLDKVQALVDDVYALDVSSLDDDDFATLERMIDSMIQVLSVLPSAEHRPLIERLLIAREGVEQGMAPDPAKRPSLEQMREFVAEHLS